MIIFTINLTLNDVVNYRRRPTGNGNGQEIFANKFETAFCSQLIILYRVIFYSTLHLVIRQQNNIGLIIVVFHLPLLGTSFCDCWHRSMPSA